MEEVYVVKVRSKPCASRLYPSERRYSASTVGGLGAVHLLLALTCLLLGALHLLALPGPAPGYGAVLGLGAASALAGLAGLLAWRRWYVDNNIRWFFISSCVAGLSALLSVALTAATLAVLVESRELGTAANSTVTQAPVPGDRSEARSVVAINIMVASTLELVWAVLSARIAWKGMRNLYPAEGEGADGADKRREEEKMKVQRDKPDIICNHKRPAPRAEVQQDGRVSREPMPVLPQEDGLCLPPMERTMDFQEKIQRFLESSREHCLNMSARDM
ncbi:uncharacterized protein LOC134535145 [Bacillus rossius redtenbacheri]|uniref:uncharacterized protein LOC134535145 n=1 Tax=Bacillus rossius redtenbacheri TaxID=93214 RepID=UPI002FDD7D1C